MAASTAERGRKLTLAATVLGSSLAFIDATVVNVALPTIESDLDLGLSGLQWVVLAYALGLAAAGIAGMLIFALGLAALVAPVTTTALASAPESLAGVASGVNMMVSRVCGLLAVAVMGLVIARVFDAAVDAPSAVPLARGQDDPGLRAASVDGWRAAIVVAAALSFAAAFVALGISNAEARRDAAGAETRAPVPAEA